MGALDRNDPRSIYSRWEVDSMLMSENIKEIAKRNKESAKEAREDQVQKEQAQKNQAREEQAGEGQAQEKSSDMFKRCRRDV